jgi:RHS repeat-associated protein
LAEAKSALAARSGVSKISGKWRVTGSRRSRITNHSSARKRSSGFGRKRESSSRLTAATNATTSAYFYYDARNRQIARAINSIVTISVWDDWELVEEYGEGNARTAAYLQGAHGPVKSLLNNIYFYQDSLGSTSHIASSTGALLESYQYDLYGKPKVYNSSGVYQPGATPIAKDLFSGERWVPELGLYDLRNRYYSPDLGRFLQPDPIGFKGDASNLYRYCGNDWANKTDPLGLEVDLDLFEPNDGTRRNVNAIPHERGTFTMGGHGTPDGRYITDQRTPGKIKFLTPKEVLREIKEKPAFKQAQRVIIYSCNLGNDQVNKHPFGEAAAKEFHKPTTAPGKSLWVDQRGRYFIAPELPHDPAERARPDREHQGKMINFGAPVPNPHNTSSSQSKMSSGYYVPVSPSPPNATTPEPAALNHSEGLGLPIIGGSDGRLGPPP